MSTVITHFLKSNLYNPPCHSALGTNSDSKTHRNVWYFPDSERRHAVGDFLIQFIFYFLKRIKAWLKNDGLFARGQCPECEGESTFVWSQWSKPPGQFENNVPKYGSVWQLMRHSFHGTELICHKVQVYEQWEAHCSHAVNNMLETRAIKSAKQITQLTRIRQRKEQKLRRESVSWKQEVEGISLSGVESSSLAALFLSCPFATPARSLVTSLSTLLFLRALLPPRLSLKQTIFPLFSAHGKEPRSLEHFSAYKIQLMIFF